MHHRMVVHSGIECSKDNFMFLVHKWYLTNVTIIHLSDNESLGRFRKKGSALVCLGLAEPGDPRSVSI